MHFWLLVRVFGSDFEISPQITSEGLMLTERPVLKQGLTQLKGLGQLRFQVGIAGVQGLGILETVT